jgi:hypothetical protein
MIHESEDFVDCKSSAIVHCHMSHHYTTYLLLAQRHHYEGSRFGRIYRSIIGSSRGYHRISSLHFQQGSRQKDKGRIEAIDLFRSQSRRTGRYRRGCFGMVSTTREYSNQKSTDSKWILCQDSRETVVTTETIVLLH